MVARRTCRVALGLLLTAGVPVGCIGILGKTDQPVRPYSRPVVIYSPAMAGATISTFAGGGVGDGGLAVEVSLYTPQAVTVDPEGNIYIADTGHHRIRRVDAKTGIITTVVGTGIAGNIGDHGRAIRAQLSSPHGLAFDPKGNLYIADTQNQRIRMLDKKGNLHPVIGKKPSAAENLIPKSHDHSLMFMSSGDSEEIVLAPPHHIFIGPQGVDLYIAESENNRVVRIDRTTKKLTVIAGVITAPGYAGDGRLATEASLMNPHSVAVDEVGNLYTADTFNHRIRKVDAATGIITTIAGTGTIGFSGDGGLATRAKLATPSGIAVSTDGSLYIVDTDNRRIRKLTHHRSGWVITTVAGTGKRGRSGDGGPALKATFVRPVDIAIDPEGNLYIADTGGHQIRKINTSGIITTIAGNGRCCFTGDGRVASHAEFTPPYGISVDQSGHLYIVDRDNHRIRRVDASSGVITTVAGNGLRGYRGNGGDALSASLSSPMSVAISKDGSIFIADLGNHWIRKVDGTTGMITTVAGGRGDGRQATEARLIFPVGVAIDAEGNLYISDTANQRIRIVKAATGLITTFAGTRTYGFSGDGGLASEAKLANPTSLTIDQEGNLYITDSDNHRIRKVDKKTGIITTVVGNGNSRLTGDGGPALQASLRYPSGITIDQNILYIADTGHHLIRMVSLKTGIITSLAGSGRAGFGGDGGSPEKATLHSPHGVAVYSNTLYIADSDNRRIRKVTLGSHRTP